MINDPNGAGTLKFYVLNGETKDLPAKGSVRDIIAGEGLNPNDWDVRVDDKECKGSGLDQPATAGMFICLAQAVAHNG